MVFAQGILSSSAFVLLACTVGCGLTSLWLGQDANWDLRNYHYYNGYAFWQSRLSLDIAPAQLQTYFNPMLDGLAFLAFEALSARACGFLLGAIQGGNLWLIYLVSRELTPSRETTGRQWVPWVCTGAAATGSIFRAQLGTTFYDCVASLFVLGAALLSLRALHTNDRQGSGHGPVMATLVAALLFGAGAGLKYTTGLYGFAFLSAFLVAPGVQGRSRTLAAWILGSTVGFLLTAGHWLLVLWHEFGNPVFPVANSVFRSPSARLEDFLDARFFPRDYWQTLFYPFFFVRDNQLTSELPFHDWRFAAVYVLFVMLIVSLWWRRRRFNAEDWRSKRVRPGVSDEVLNKEAWLLTFVMVSYIAWQTLFSIYRYAIPLELLAPVIVVVLVRHVVPVPSLVPVLSAIVLLILAVNVRAAEWGRVPWSESFVEVDAPVFPVPERTVVLMTSTEPMAFVAPHFQPQVRFVRLESNFHDVSDDTRMADTIRGLLANSAQDLYLLTTREALDEAAQLLGLYALRFDRAKVQPLHTNLDNRLVIVHLEDRAAARFSWNLVYSRCTNSSLAAYAARTA